MDRIELEAHPITSGAQAYIDSMNPEQKELHILATKLLASSYFVEQTRGYTAWKQTTKPK